MKHQEHVLLRLTFALYMRWRGRWFGKFAGSIYEWLYFNWLGPEAPPPLPECTDSHCRGNDKKHGCCETCGQLTCQSGFSVEPASLRRIRVFRCNICPESESTNALRHERTQRDWRDLSDAVDPAGLALGTMTEQYPGESRRLVRAFLDSGATEATVEGLMPTPSMLQRTIRSLGLSEQVYAEQRGNTTVLRLAAAAERVEA